MADTKPVNSVIYSGERKLRLAYFVSHPIQYQAPLLRRIARERDIDLRVFFSSNISVKEYADPGFGAQVKWDVPLLTGYSHEFLPVLLGANRFTFWMPLNYGIRQILSKGRFDAVWVHGYNRMMNLQVLLACHALKIPVLLRAESTLTDRPRSRQTLTAKSYFFRFFLKPRVSAVLPIGKANEAYWNHYFGEQMPSFPFRYSVDNDFFQRECGIAAKNREEFRKSLGLENGRPIILYASKLQTRKRCGDLMEAFLRISKFFMSERRPYLLIVGDGAERATLEERAKAAAPGDVRFLGFRNQTELPRFYDLCNVFVLVSIHEPWGLVINEVMNAGRAVIVSDEVGCQTDLVRSGVNGWVVKSKDIDGLAESLRHILADENTWLTMGEQSQRTIQSYNFEQNVSGLRQALQHVAPGFQAVPAI